MGTIFKILALCHLLGHFGSVTSDSCGSDSQSQMILLVNMKPLTEFLATKKQSQGSESPKYLYSKDDISCSIAGDEPSCSEQKCCLDKTPKCNGGTKKCDCFDKNSNKFTGRPLIYLQNSGKCGDNEVGCTICLDLETAKKTLGLDQGRGEGLEGNGSALALSAIGNQTSLMENDGRDVRMVDVVIDLVNSVTGGGLSRVFGTVTSTVGGLVGSTVASIAGSLGISL